MSSSRDRVLFIVLTILGIMIAFAMQFVQAVPSVGVVFAVFALVIAFLLFGLKDYSYLIDPILRMKGRSLVLDANDPYYLSANGKAIIIRTPTLVYATSYIKIPIYKSSTEMSDEEKLNFSNLFSRAISISTVPMRISSQLYLVDKTEYLKVITEKMSVVEDRYNTIQGDPVASKTSLNRVKGEVNMWHNLLDGVTNSNTQSQVAYVTVSASGGSEDEASNLVNIAAEQLAAGLGATLGVPTSVVTGQDMLLFVEPDYLIPAPSVSEFDKNMQK